MGDKSISGVSVIMAFKNAERFIDESITSILHQTKQNFELILIDDASTDMTVKILEQYLGDNRIKIICNSSTKGKSANLNAGIVLASHEYIAILDGDDVAMPERLQKQVDFLDNHPDIAAVGSFVQIIDENGGVIDTRTKPTNPEDIRNKILFYNPLLQPSVMLRKSVLLTVGLYSEIYAFAQDIDMWFRIVFSGYKVSNVPEFLIKYRIHSQNTGRNNRKVAIDGFNLKRDNIRKFALRLNAVEWFMIYGQFIVEYVCSEPLRRVIESIAKRIIIGKK